MVGPEPELEAELESEPLRVVAVAAEGVVPGGANEPASASAPVPVAPGLSQREVETEPDPSFVLTLPEGDDVVRVQIQRGRQPGTDATEGRGAAATGPHHGEPSRLIAEPATVEGDVDESLPAAPNEPESEPLSRAVKLAYIVVFAVLALSAVGLLYVHLKPSEGVHSTHTDESTTTTSAPTTTTTTALPTALKPKAEDAATALVANWAAGNRAAALTVATSAAVTALFATPYASGLAIDRGCSTSFSPIVCTFGPPGGASPTDPIYQIDVTQAPGGWYVSSVKTEN